jgi:GTPase Era involved in 16S rRNA processing
MNLELEILSGKMEKLFNEVIIKESILSLGNLKDDLLNKKELVSEFRTDFVKRNLGKNSKKLMNELGQIEADFNNLYENFDDKLMIFIIGNGNVGKSTLLNSLIGYEVAETNFIPNTWKIDIYSPEIDKNTAIIKYTDGKQEKLQIDKVKEIINAEEKKSKESKKNYNENLNKELKGLRTKEEREEMKTYLAEKYLYKSNVAEVRWPVEKNLILEKCLLVDTPGLNQNLNNIDQLGDIHNYYHKADGVLWLLDGQTIAAAKANTLFEELNDVLQTVGGVRDNIVGVINRIDLVRKNGGEEAVLKVGNDAKKIFGNKFSKIIDVSAEQAFEGVKNNEFSVIQESGILNLQKAIRDIFISKSDSVKSGAKEQGHNKLLDVTLQRTKEFYLQVEEYCKMYNEKEERLISSKEKLVTDLSKDVDNFFESYLREVSKRVDIHIDSLAEGKDSSFIKNTMYKLDDFIISRGKFIDSKQLEIKNNTYIWEKFCKISEYKYIQNTAIVEVENVLTNVNFNLSSLNSISYFTPSVEDDLFSFLGNVFGKAMFWIRKGGIKSKINDSIRQECNKMKEDIINRLNINIEKSFNYCKDIKEITFSNILFYFKDEDSVKKEIKEFELKMKKKSESIKLKDIITKGC